MEDVETVSALYALSFTPHPSCPLEGMVSSHRVLVTTDLFISRPGAPRVQWQWGLRVTVRSITAAPAWLSVHSGNIHNNHLDTPTAGREPGRADIVCDHGLPSQLLLLPH